MAYVREYAVALTTDAAGDDIGYTRAVTGRIEQIRYVKNNFADGVDFVVTLEDSGVTVWSETDVNASTIVRPRVQLQGTDGSDLTYDGTYPVVGRIYVPGERVKVVVASGGDSKSGTVYIGIG